MVGKETAGETGEACPELDSGSGDDRAVSAGEVVSGGAYAYSYCAYSGACVVDELCVAEKPCIEGMELE